MLTHTPHTQQAAHPSALQDLVVYIGTVLEELLALHQRQQAYKELMGPDAAPVPLTLDVSDALQRALACFASSKTKTIPRRLLHQQHHQQQQQLEQQREVARR